MLRAGHMTHICKPLPACAFSHDEAQGPGIEEWQDRVMTRVTGSPVPPVMGERERES